MAGSWKPVADHTYLWDTASTIFAGCPVVASSTNDMVTVPAVAATDHIVGIAQEDAGPSAVGSAINETDIAVQIFGTAKCFGKSGITAGDYLKIAATISVTLNGVSSTVYPLTTATRATAGSQPVPIVGRAKNSTSADGDIVYVDLMPGATY